MQWSVAYVALAYSVQHAVILTIQSFEWPRFGGAHFHAAPGLGAAGGDDARLVSRRARASRRISGPELTIISIPLVIGADRFYVFARPSEEIATGPKSSVQQASVAGGTAKPDGISIAVLLFVNLSGDATQEFFSDGMTEEITSVLAKIPNLQVVGRTDSDNWSMAGRSENGEF